MESVVLRNTDSAIQLADAARDVNETLDGFFIEYARHAEILHPAYQQLWLRAHDLSKSGGKRLRPYLTLLTYQTYGGKEYKDILPVAAAQELLHFAMLIHDDIIDRDTIRYGTDNVIGQYEHIYAPSILESDERRHFANSAALLAGDVCLAGAFELSSRAKISDVQHMQVRHALWHIIFTVVGGELIDTEAAFRSEEEMVADAMTVNRNKTADYTCVRPLMLGAELAHASGSEVNILKQLGLHLGIAFQLVDDNIGIYGDSDITGKPVGADIREGKRTFLFERSLELANEAQRIRLRELHGKKDLSHQENVEFCEIVQQTGAFDIAREQIAEHREIADKLVETLSIADEYKTGYHEIILLMIEREV